MFWLQYSQSTNTGGGELFRDDKHYYVSAYAELLFNIYNEC